MDESQERAVVDGLRAGSPDAWHALYDAYSERVWHRVALLAGKQCDVADIVQETFLAAARSAGKYDPNKGTLWQWLWGIARNQVSQHFRKQKQLTRLGSSPAAMRHVTSENGQTDLLGWLENREDAPAEIAVSAELAETVREVLAAMSEQHQSLLIARYFDGTDVKQIAEAENCSHDAVRSRLVRARQSFRREFNKVLKHELSSKGVFEL